MFLCVGPRGQLAPSQHGPLGKEISSRTMNNRESTKRPVPSSSTPASSPKPKSGNKALFDPSISAVVCSYCGKQFTDSVKFKHHAAYHKQEGRFPCKFCGKAFHSRPNRVAHERVHTGERPFKCSVCNLGFSSLSNQKRHESIHFP